MRLRQHQRRQPPRLQLAHRDPGLRRARGAQRRGVGARAAQTFEHASLGRAGRGRAEAASHATTSTKRAERAIATHPRRELQHTMETGCGIYRTGGVAQGDRREGRRAEGAIQERPARRPQPQLQHRAHHRARARVHARHRGGARALRAGAHGIARLAPAHRLPEARRRAVPQALTRVSRRRRPAHRLPRRGHHQVAAGRACLRTDH